MHSVPVDNDRVRAAGMACARNMVEVVNKVTFRPFQLFSLLKVGGGIEGCIVVFLLTKFSHTVCIDARFLVKFRLALYHTVDVTLRLERRLAGSIGSCSTSLVP